MGGSLCTRMRAWVIVVCRGRLVKLMGAILSGIFGGLKLFFFSRDERKKLENFFVRVLFILIFLYLCIYDYII